MTNTVIFLPVRRGSDRVKHKNIRQFAGIEGGLVQLKLRQLLQLEKIPIILSTDSPEAMAIARNFDSPRITLNRRPDKLCKATTNLQDLIDYVPQITTAEHILWTHVTSPLVDASLYRAALNDYFAAREQGFDSLMSVTTIQEFLWDAQENDMINYDRRRLKWPRTQDLNPLYAVNSAIFINAHKNYLTRGDRIGKNPYLFPLQKKAGWDIDREEDFIIAEKLYENTFRL